MAEEILYTLKIEGTDTELKKLEQINQNMVELKKQIKETGNESSKNNEERKVQLKQEQEDYRNLQKEIKRRNKAEEEGAQTLEKMRARLMNLNKELDKTPVNTKRFKDLTAQSKKLRDEIKGADEATGRFQGNVGNYKGAIMDAFQQMGVNVLGFTSTLNTASTAMSGVTKATKGSSKAMKLFRLALISTGIGAIVVALGSLVAYLASTQKGVDTVNKVLKPLGAVFDRIVGLVQEFGEGIAMIFSGDFVAGFKKLGSTLKSVDGAIVDAWKDGQRLADIIIEIDNARLKLAQNEGRIARAMAEQKEIIEDINKSDKERKAAGEEFLRLSNELLNYKKEIADLEYEQAKINSDLNDTSREEQIELAELKEKQNALEAESLSKQQEIKNKINSIDKSAADERIKEAQRLDALQTKFAEAQAAAFTERLDKQRDELAEYVEDTLDLMDEEILAEIEKEDAADELRFEKLMEYEEAVRELKEQFRQEELTAQQKELEELDNQLEEKLLSEEEYQDRRVKIEEKYAAISKNIKKQEIDSKLGLAAQGLGQISDIAGKETKVGKAAAIAQATINTYLAASNAFASAGNPILGAIMAAIAVAGGLIQVAKIANTKTNVPKFARGVIGLDGAGTATSDSIDAKLSRGESVMTARATKAFAPVLAEMERSVGNVPNYQLGNKRFAGGLIGQPRTEYPTDYERVMEQTINNISNIPVVVSETDITSTQDKVREIKVTGDL